MGCLLRFSRTYFLKVIDILSPFELLHAHAVRQPHTDAIVVDGTRMSYQELIERVAACCAWLIQRGISSDDLVGICIRDLIDHVVGATALFCLGVPQICIGSHEHADARRKLAQKVGVTRLLVESLDPWMQDFETLSVPAAHWYRLTPSPPPTSSALMGARALDTLALYRTTSGSTNIPKAFGLNLLRFAATTASYTRDPKLRRSLRTSSIEFDSGRLFLCMLLAGHSCLFTRCGSAPELVDVCKRERISMLMLGPYKTAGLLKTKSHARFPADTALQLSGSRVPGPLREQIVRRLTNNLWIQYATSEFGVIAIATPHEHADFPEGLGFPVSDLTIEIVGPDGEISPPGDIGEIRLHRRGMATDYVGEPNTRNFRNGMFYPGDLISQPLGAPLLFHGRSDDTMILNGINIFPAAIEDLLESHAEVTEAIAFPIRSRVNGEIPAAAVVLSPQAQSTDTSHLLDLCRKALGIRAPRKIIVVDQIPRSAAGKPLRREMRDS